MRIKIIVGELCPFGDGTAHYLSRSLWKNVSFYALAYLNIQRCDSNSNKKNTLIDSTNEGVKNPPADWDAGEKR